MPLCDAAAAMRLASQSNVPGTPGAPEAAAGTNYQASFTGVTNFPSFNLLNIGTQTITFDAMQPVMVDAGEIDGNATATSELPVEYTSSDESITKIINGKIQIVSAGVVTITRHSGRRCVLSESRHRFKTTDHQQGFLCRC